MFHIPVMVEEVLRYLFIGDGVYLDCTAGGGGHLSATLECLKQGIVVAVDMDPEAVEYLMNRFNDPKVIIRQANFRDIKQVSRDLQIDRYDGIFFDLGVSLHQVKQPERGFSYDQDGLLDMRMDPSICRSALDLIRESSEKTLRRIIKDYGEDPGASRLARLIYRRKKEIVRTGDLRRLIEGNTGYRFRKKTLHRVFQAFRIAVNDELGNLKAGLDSAYQLLKDGGRLVCIAYHSLEDRIVKQSFRRFEEFKILTKKPIRPSEVEIERNPGSRSAKLRAGERR